MVSFSRNKLPLWILAHKKNTLKLKTVILQFKDEIQSGNTLTNTFIEIINPTAKVTKSILVCTALRDGWVVEQIRASSIG